MQDAKKHKKMRTFLWIVAVFLFLFLVVYPGLLFVSGVICHPFYSGNGWTCGLPSVSLRAVCALKGGNYKKTLVIPSGGMKYECYLPYSDGGQSCIDDDECSGYCEYSGSIPTTCVMTESDDQKDIYTCSEKLSGTCGKTSEGHNEDWKSLDNGNLYLWEIIDTSNTPGLIW